MDPTAQPAGTINTISGLDLQAIDVIGWNLVVGGRYWDTNGSAFSSSNTGGNWTGATWSGSEGGVSPTGIFDPNASGNDTAVFAAGNLATGTYSINVTGTQNVGGLSFDQGTVTLSGAGTVRLNDATPDVNVGTGLTATVNAIVSGANGLTKTGAGTLVLGGTNTYTGGIALTAGTLSGTTNSIVGNTALTSGTTLAFNQGTAGAYSGVLTGSGATVQVTGGGIVTLSGNSPAYTGSLQVTSTGHARVNGNMSGASLAVVSGGTIGGTGSLGALNLPAGAILAPGNSPGTLNVSSLTLNDATVLNYELATAGTIGASVNDLVASSGAVVFDGNLNVTPLAGFNAGTYTLVTSTSAPNVSGFTSTSADFTSTPDDFAYRVFAQGNNVAMDVLDFANPAPASSSLTVSVNPSTPTSNPLAIANQSIFSSAYTLNLDLDSTVENTDPSGLFSFTSGVFDELLAGSSSNVNFLFAGSNTPGTYAATYTFNFSNGETAPGSASAALASYYFDGTGLSNATFTYTVNVLAVVPEPSRAILLVAGIAFLGRRRRSK